MKQTGMVFTMITFSLAEEAYGIDVMKVKKIAGYSGDEDPSISQVQNDSLHIIDLRFLLGLPVRDSGEDSSMIVLHYKGRSVGLVVDHVDRVVSVASKTIRTAHHSRRGYIGAVVEIAHRRYDILDLEKILFKMERPVRSPGLADVR